MVSYVEGEVEALQHARASYHCQGTAADGRIQQV
jgi:hypothetical protein